MPDTTPDSSGISFTALYTGAVWQHNQLSDPLLATPRGELLYHLMAPFDGASRLIAGGNLRNYLLQRHLIIDALIAKAVEDAGVTHVVEIACGLSPRGLRLRQRYPHLTVIEADLPAMAARKADALGAAGVDPQHHRVCPVDILAGDGDHTLEALLTTQCPAGKPVVVITEGLINYFTLPVISGFWQRLATLLAQRPGSRYLFDSFSLPANPLVRSGILTLKNLLGGLTRSAVSLHFDSDQAAIRHLGNCGFAQVFSHNPEQYYRVLPIPQSRGNPLVRIIEARQG